MKKQNLLILIILVAGGFSSVYAATTIITDTSITTQDLTITGTCTGCGGGSGSFASYSVLTNTTVGSSSGQQILSVQTSTDGSILSCDSSNNRSIVFVNGTQFVISNSGSDGCDFSTWLHNGQSSDGEYKFIFDDSNNNLIIYKNNSILQIVTIAGGDFSTASISKGGFAMSSDGKYIDIYGKDIGGALDRLVVLQGS